MPTRTDTELEILEAIESAGALTSRRIEENFGPRPNWHRLLKDGMLKETKTVYGPALTLSAAHADRLGIDGRLSGAGPIADRAYMNDAVETLVNQGYTWLRFDFKRGPTLGTHTSHIVRALMRVPPGDLRRIRAEWPRHAASQDARRPSHSSVDALKGKLGEVYLYARCSGGGIQPPEIRRLLKRHYHDLLEWRSPLLLVVPKDEGALRTFVRGHLAKKEAAHAKFEKTGLSQPHAHIPDFTLITQPLPDLIYRPSRLVKRD
ncbi:hypothetical protein [Deinococcus sp. ME38]|uniref:hypothetical protein n=1 Tax=Deinococcus sp. ME38 TaxID=3400344 RepID=UPI003B5C8D64